MDPKFSSYQNISQVKLFRQFLYADNYDEQLRLECTLSDYRLTEVVVCSVNSKVMPSSSSNASMSSRSVSTSDILRLQQQTQSHTNLSNPSIIDHSESGRRAGNTRLVG